ncbi:hypothetical protein BZM27_36565 [Paraburkholderia steynii]|uniref:SIS domain-containing protein n=1 Tax=Paraburkholderia steynii TaxID=1245441 RepID=A0A4R0X828_9BURK|nr:hypothetical protein BZM27_36565 [Paraburkholderia steynii]
MQLRSIAKGHATVVISFAPYSREAARVAEAAREQGSKLVAITDGAVAPIAAPGADEVLLFTHDSPSFFPSLVAASAIEYGRRRLSEQLRRIHVSRWTPICWHLRETEPSSNCPRRKTRYARRVHT